MPSSQDIALTASAGEQLKTNYQVHEWRWYYIWLPLISTAVIRFSTTGYRSSGKHCVTCQDWVNRGRKWGVAQWYICTSNSKTDPLHQAMDVFLGATNTKICSVQSILHYIEVHSPAPGPLFIFQSGSSLTHSALCLTFQSTGVSPTAYTGHIGTATTAARCRIVDFLIQTLGHWKIAAYLKDFLSTAYLSLQDFIRFNKQVNFERKAHMVARRKVCKHRYTSSVDARHI